MLQSCRNAVIYGLFIALSSQIVNTDAVARSYTFQGRHYSSLHKARQRPAFGAGNVIQCTVFAKQDAGIVLPGNARDWWANAAGVYQRGEQPEPGSVLAFAANVRMPLGHVAVVSNVVDSRTISIDQAHWNSRGVTRDIEVKDVSEDNDWSAVRVQLGHNGDFGSIYPTRGFIYARPDTTGRIVEASVRAPLPAMDRAPADLRRASARHHDTIAVEVAEMPHVTRGLDLSLNGIGDDAPDRAFQ
jgi:surface antigen